MKSPQRISGAYDAWEKAGEDYDIEKRTGLKTG